MCVNTTVWAAKLSFLLTPTGKMRVVFFNIVTEYLEAIYKSSVSCFFTVNKDQIKS